MTLCHMAHSAVTGPKRVAALPSVPTVVEQCFPNLIVEDRVGFAMKSGTPGSQPTAKNCPDRGTWPSPLNCRAQKSDL